MERKSADPFRATLILLLLTVFPVTPVTTLATELPDKFKANYTLEKFGIILAEATHTLVHTENGLSMAVSSKAVGLLALFYDGTVDIHSDIVRDNGQLLLVNHDYTNSADPEDTTVRYEINWENHDQDQASTATGIYKGEQININSNQPIWDPLSIQALIIINADKQTATYEHGLLLKDEIKHYLFENQGKETIRFNDTDFTALKTAIKETKRDRVIYVWMLPEYHNIPIKYEHWKEGKLKSTIRLQSVTFENDGNTTTLILESPEKEDDEDFE